MGATARTVLVTGGMGYVGAHASLVLAQTGWRVVIVDNLRNAKASVLDRLKALAPHAAIEFVRLDVRDRPELEALLRGLGARAVMHFAGLKSVDESVAQPQLYYENNVGGTMAVLQAMRACGVRTMIFSSSATVYGEPQSLPITEQHRLAPVNPYGRTKLFVEEMLGDEALADPGFRFAALRYFNPVGAHPSGALGEDPAGIPANLFPYIAQVAVGRRPALKIYGTDYATEDGTGVRDYIHVMDLARGHLAALEYLEAGRPNLAVNLGTGVGYSVRQAVQAFERAAGRPIAAETAPRRPGDVAACYADVTLAREALGWSATLGIEAMCRDHWNWQSRNPLGYP